MIEADPALDRTPRILPAWLLVVGILAVSCGESPLEPMRTGAPPAKPAAAGPRVIFLGDSITAGLHLDDPDTEAFPARLARELAREGRPIDLVNAGVSGDTTAGGRRRLDWLLRQSPALLVVELGGNDGLRGLSLDAVETNLRAILKGASDRGVPILLLGMRVPTNFGRDYDEAFAAIYERLAAESGATFVPYFMEGVAGVPELNFPDGIHPTSEGHRRLAEKLLPVLRRLLD